MAPRQQTSRRDQRSGRSTIIVDHRAEALRPVALPALAAAVRAATPAHPSARAALLAGTGPSRFEHEDTPPA